MEIEYDSIEKYGTVYLTDGEILVSGDFESLADMKNFAVKTFADEFDRNIKQNLGITFPYKIGNITFYSLSELNSFVLGKQRNRH